MGHVKLLALLVATVVSGVTPLSGQAVPTATGPGASLAAGVGLSAFHIDYGKRTLGGLQAWVDANPWWWGGLEFEARTLLYNQDLNTHASTFLVGPRLSLSPGTVEPYVKAMAGRGSFDFPYGYAHGTYLVVAGGGGVDLHLGKHLQWRMLDVQYQSWPRFTFGALRSYGVSTGISIKLTGARHHGRAAH